jgi:hypothetical protein
VHAWNQHAEVGEVEGEVSVDGATPVADGGGEPAHPHSGALDGVHRAGKRIVGHRCAGALFPVQEAQFEGGPTQRTVGGDLAVDAVGRFVGESGEGKHGSGVSRCR